MESPPLDPHQDRPKSSFRHLIWAGLFMLCGLSLLIYLGSDRRKVLGQPVLELDLQPLIYTEMPFEPAEARGKVVLLHFWGPWCPPCRVEYPEIEKLAATYADGKSVRIVSISCAATAPDDIAQLRQDTLALLGEASTPHPIHCDPVEFSRIGIAKLLGQRGFSYPTSILLDRQGRIVDYWIRPTSQGELDRAIRSTLAQSPVGTR